MLKKYLAILSIILFAASIFACNAPEKDRPPNKATTQNLTKHKEPSKTYQGKPSSQRKSTKRKA